MESSGMLWAGNQVLGVVEGSGRQASTVQVVAELAALHSAAQSCAFLVAVLTPARNT